MTKTETALMRLAERQIEVKQLTVAIGSHLADCLEHAITVLNQSPHEYESHLSIAYKDEGGEEYVGGVCVPRKLTICEVAELLEEDDGPLSCQHCAAAHRLIQERKLARVRLGRAKATLTMMGRRLLAAAPKPEGGK